MKKVQVWGILFITISFILLASTLVSARSPLDDLRSGSKALFDSILQPLFQTVLGDIPGEQYLFAKSLLFLIVLAIVWISLSQIDFFSEYKLAHWGISLAASILAIRWIGGKAMIDTLILPYSALGIALSAAVPFLLWFFIVEIGLADPADPKKYRLTRRFAWIFFFVIFVGLWYSRYDLITAATGNDALAGYIYPATAALALLIMSLDGTIQRARNKLIMESVGKETTRTAITEIKRKLADLPNLVATGIITIKESDKRKKEYFKMIAELSR
ncbi:MAG: hypothetical protein AABY00_02125 [Nanoarchaeota archaeon]